MSVDYLVELIDCMQFFGSSSLRRLFTFNTQIPGNIFLLPHPVLAASKPPNRCDKELVKAIQNFAEPDELRMLGTCPVHALCMCSVHICVDVDTLVSYVMHSILTLTSSLISVYPLSPSFPCPAGCMKILQNSLPPSEFSRIMPLPHWMNNKWVPHIVGCKKEKAEEWYKVGDGLSAGIVKQSNFLRRKKTDKNGNVVADDVAAGAVGEGGADGKPTSAGGAGTGSLNGASVESLGGLDASTSMVQSVVLESRPASPGELSLCMCVCIYVCVCICGLSSLSLELHALTPLPPPSSLLLHTHEYIYRQTRSECRRQRIPNKTRQDSER